MTPEAEIASLRRELESARAFALALANHLADASEVLGRLAEKGRRNMALILHSDGTGTVTDKPRTSASVGDRHGIRFCVERRDGKFVVIRRVLDKDLNVDSEMEVGSCSSEPLAEELARKMAEVKGMPKRIRDRRKKYAPEDDS